MIARALLFSALCALTLGQTTSDCDNHCAVETDGVCTQCTSGYTLQTSYFGDTVTYSQCDRCDTHCADACNATSNSSYSCEVCDSGYFAHFGSCYSCAGKTDTTSCNATTECTTGYTLLPSYGVCLTDTAFVCEVVHDSPTSILSCNYPNNTGCADGYEFDESSKSCSTCAPHCGDAADNCTSMCTGDCDSGYYKVQAEGASAGTCFKCPTGCSCPTTTQTEFFSCASCSGSLRSLSTAIVDGAPEGTFCVNPCISYFFDFQAQNCTNDTPDGEIPFNYCARNDTSASCCQTLSNFYAAGCTVDGTNSLALDYSFFMDLQRAAFPGALLTASDYDSYETAYYNAFGFELGITAEVARIDQCRSDYPAVENCTSAEMGDFYTAECTSPIISVGYSVVISSTGSDDIGYTSNDAMEIAMSLIPSVAEALDVNTTDVSISTATFDESTDTVSIDFAVVSPSETVDSAAIETALGSITNADVTSAIEGTSVSIPAGFSVDASSTVEVVAVETPTQSPASSATLALPLIAFATLVLRM